MSELTNIENPNLIDRDYNRKPYQSESYDEMMDRVPGKAMQDQRQEAESEFKKPYLSDSYEEMEQFFMPPFPFGPDPDFPDFPGPVPSYGDDEWMDAHADGGKLPCSIFCVSNGTGPEKCERPVRCKWSRVTPEDTPLTERWSILPNKDGVTPSIGRIAITKDSTLYPVKIYPPSGGWGANVPEGKQSFDLKIQYEDANGTKCTDTVLVRCVACECPSDPAFEFDDANTPDTIVAGNHISVYIKDGTGCPPFTYSVSGTGYTWNANGSTSLSSNNRNEQLDCADGT